MTSSLKILQPALEVAARLHPKGKTIYHSKGPCVEVLKAIESLRLPWWDSSCSKLVQQVERCVIPSDNNNNRKYPTIVVEGLDGVGKTTVTTNLANMIEGELIRTPNPDLEGLRENFRLLPEPLSRAFYCGANYLAAKEMMELTQVKPVVFDRWWGSTCSMALASIKDGSGGTIADLPPLGDSVYTWPSDLPTFDLGILLDVSEEIRMNRVKGRGNENREEKQLAEKEGMRAAAMEAYRRMDGLYTTVQVTTYMHGINDIFDLMTALRDTSSHHGQEEVRERMRLALQSPKVVKFTEEQMAACKRW